MNTHEAQTDLPALIQAGAITIEVIDTATAQLDPNVRSRLDGLDILTESIREVGVQEPVRARRGDNGEVYVWDGQRRLLAAREAGVEKMLAVFGLRDHNGSEADRILDQLRTFTREDLNLVDRVKAVEQLTLEGVSVAKIARSTGQSKDDVKAAVKVAKSEVALRAIDTYQLTLDRALYAAEFGDDEDALSAIADADEEELEFIAQQLRDRRELDEHTEKLIAKLQAEGKTIANSYNAGAQLWNLTDADADAEDRPALDAETHAACPGAIYNLRVWGTEETEHRLEQLCSRPELHKPRYGTSVARPTAGPVDETDEEREARLDAEKDAQRRERRRVVKYNRMWRSASKLRLQWLSELVNRKKLPVDANAFVALTLTRFRYEAINSEHSSILGKLLGFEGYDERNHQPRRRALRSGEPHQRVLLATAEQDRRGLPAGAGVLGLPPLRGRADRRRVRRAERRPGPRRVRRRRRGRGTGRGLTARGGGQRGRRPGPSRWDAPRGGPAPSRSPREPAAAGAVDGAPAMERLRRSHLFADFAGPAFHSARSRKGRLRRPCGMRCAHP